MSTVQNSVSPVLLPALGESVTEGTVTRWLKRVGEPVEAEEPLLEVSTDKVDTEIPSPVAGTLTDILVMEDEVVEVGARLATITTAAPANARLFVSEADEAHPPASTSPPAAPPTSSAFTIAPPAASVSAAPLGRPAQGPRRSRLPSEHLTPVVRRLAAELAVDLSTVSGTGLEGRIRKQDVLAAVTAATQTVEPLRTAGQLTSVVEVDVTEIMNLCERGRAVGNDLNLTAFIANACVEALKAHPTLNASIDAGRQGGSQTGAINLAVVVDSPHGPLAPVVAGAGDLSVTGLARRIDDLAQRAQTENRAPEDRGGTFTLRHTGSRGVLFHTPMIDRPQVAALSAGPVVRRPVVLHSGRLGEAIAIRSMSYLALSHDYRVVGEADAAGFLTEVRERLERAQLTL